MVHEGPGISPHRWYVFIHFKKYPDPGQVAQLAGVIGFLFICFLKILLVLEQEREGEREVEKHQCVVASCAPPTGDLASNPGMSPDWKSNQQPFDSLAGAQSTEPPEPS